MVKTAAIGLGGLFVILLLVTAVWSMAAPLFAEGVVELADSAAEISAQHNPAKPENHNLVVEASQLETYTSEMPVITGEIDWTLVDVTETLQSSQVLFFESEGVEEDLGSLLEDPSTNNGCKQVEEVFGLKCRWEAKAESDHTITIRLKIGDHEIAVGTGKIAKLTEFPEFLEVVNNGYHFAWSFHVQVARGLTSLGIGRFVLKNMDRAAYHVASSRQLTLTRLFIDMSAVKWGPKMMEGIKPIWEDPVNGMWIYKLVEPK